jgi:hypothetical protein
MLEAEKSRRPRQHHQVGDARRNAGNEDEYDQAGSLFKRKKVAHFQAQ